MKQILVIFLLVLNAAFASNPPDSSDDVGDLLQNRLEGVWRQEYQFAYDSPYSPTLRCSITVVCTLFFVNDSFNLKMYTLPGLSASYSTLESVLAGKFEAGEDSILFSGRRAYLNTHKSVIDPDSSSFEEILSYKFISKDSLLLTTYRFEDESGAIGMMSGSIMFWVPVRPFLYDSRIFAYYVRGKSSN